MQFIALCDSVYKQVEEVFSIYSSLHNPDLKKPIEKILNAGPIQNFSGNAKLLSIIMKFVVLAYHNWVAIKYNYSKYALHQNSTNNSMTEVEQTMISMLS